MQEILKVAMLPMDITWADRSENLSQLEEAMRRLRPDTDLVVLPELFSTGFIDDPELLATISEDASGAAMRVVKRLAAQYNVAIAGSFLARDNGALYNRGFIVEPDGQTATYDKCHLFCISPEAQLMHRGNAEPPVIRFRGWNISLVVCYDLRFPAWCRNRGGRYDILLVPANWPDARRYAWEHLLIARAIENQAVVVGVNRSGADDYGCYDGMSAAYDHKGMPITPDNSTPVNNPKDWIYITADRQVMHQAREKLPFLKDADSYTYNN